MTNGIVTTFCTAAICCAIQGWSGWMQAYLLMAMIIAVWNNLQWAKVFKAAAMVLKRKQGGL